MKTYRFALAALSLLLLVGCLDSRPKVLGRVKLNYDSDSDTTTPENFRLKFAFRDAAASAPQNKLVYLQGINNSKSTFTNTCNSAGTGCVCVFLDASQAVIRESATGEVSYDSVSNFVRCEYNGSLAALQYVRLRNLNNTKATADYPVDTTLTAHQIVGSELDFNRLRTIYKYSCLNNFLQKDGTNGAVFDCSNSNSQCATNASGNFCLLQGTFPYNLYRDNYTNNLNQKITDKIYNQAGDGRVCGVQIKEVDCGGANGKVEPDFGLFAEQTGIFDVPVQLEAGPSQGVSTYGFAAKISEYKGVKICPPGMVMKRTYQATPTPSTDIGPSHNFPNQNVRQVANADTAPTDFEVNQVAGGNCDGTACTLPTAAMGRIGQVYPYTATTLEEFCVIPAKLLPTP